MTEISEPVEAVPEQPRVTAATGGYPDNSDARRSGVLADSLKLRTLYPDSKRVVIRAEGEIDDAELDRFRELVMSRLAAVPEIVVVDLSDVRFVSVSTLELLRNASHQCEQTGRRLFFVVNSREVLRGLRQAELAHLIVESPAEAGVTSC